jgi:hypothetical protein
MVNKPTLGNMPGVACQDCRFSRLLSMQTNYASLIILISHEKVRYLKVSDIRLCLLFPSNTASFSGHLEVLRHNPLPLPRHTAPARFFNGMGIEKCHCKSKILLYDLFRQYGWVALDLRPDVASLL